MCSIYIKSFKEKTNQTFTLTYKCINILNSDIKVRCAGCDNNIVIFKRVYVQ